ncbi:MAG TPA: hypothetical protein VMV98_01910 [Acidobacteriaceae bacterium]|nr:hypothetical protein [Acidobacteriaceae bacterium]
MKLLMDDVASYKSAVALLAVHSAIAFNDAVLERLTGAVPKRKDHADGHRQTKEACSRKKIDAAGVQHLQRLIASKTSYSYAGIVDEKKAQDAADKAEKFANWAYKNVLKREQPNA